MDINAYHGLIAEIIKVLESTAKRDPQAISFCKSGDDFELCVVNATKEALKRCGLSATIHHTPGSHIFPDIIIEDSISAQL